MTVGKRRATPLLLLTDAAASLMQHTHNDYNVTCPIWGSISWHEKHKEREVEAGR